jgi:hypothetical protein
METFIKKKRQEQESYVYLKTDDRPANSSSRLSNEGVEVRRSQIMESQITSGGRMRNSFIKNSKLRGSNISNNATSRVASNIKSNREAERPVSLYELNNRQGSQLKVENGENKVEGMTKKSRLVHEVCESACECEVKLSIFWTDSDPKRCEQLIS